MPNTHVVLSTKRMRFQCIIYITYVLFNAFFVLFFVTCCFFFRDSLKMTHTILLVQPATKPESRTYTDYESVNECLEGVCKIYEEHLKRKHPDIPSITYDISQLFEFIDQLADLSCLVYQKSTNTYAPYNKEWIKEKIYILLRRQAAQK